MYHITSVTAFIGQVPLGSATLCGVLREDSLKAEVALETGGITHFYIVCIYSITAAMLTDAL